LIIKVGRLPDMYYPISKVNNYNSDIVTIFKMSRIQTIELSALSDIGIISTHSSLERILVVS